MSENQSSEPTRKTWKREMAAIMLVFGGFVAWQAAQDDAIKTLEIIIWPIVFFATAAFGLKSIENTDLVNWRK